MGLRKNKSLLDQAIDHANDYVEAAKPHVEAAYGSARDFVQDTALPALVDAREKAAPVIADARDKATPVIASGVALAGAKATEAREKAGPALAEARDRASTKAAPLLASGQALATEKANAARTMADAKVAQLKGEPEPAKGSKLKKLVLFTAIAGGVAFVAKKLQGGKAESNNWQSSYVPTPPPSASSSAAPTPSQAAAPAEDSGGSSPDEALADAAEAPHPVTTPDEPAEVVDLEEPKG